MDNVFVYVIGMDPLVTEQVVANSDGSYSIFLNDCLSPERRFRAYIHALDHIYNGDFERYTDVDTIEVLAHSE